MLFNKVLGENEKYVILLKKLKAVFGPPNTKCWGEFGATGTLIHGFENAK